MNLLSLQLLQIDIIHFDFQFTMNWNFWWTNWFQTFFRRKEFLKEMKTEESLQNKCLLNRDWASLWKDGNNWVQSRTLAPKMFAQANPAPTLSLHLPPRWKRTIQPSFIFLKYITFCPFSQSVYQNNLFLQSLFSPSLSCFSFQQFWSIFC